MHVHELNPKKTLITVILFVLVILIGFITLKKPNFRYKANMEQSLEMLKDKDACFHPWQLADVLSEVDASVTLIDIRDKFVFGQGHIPGAENISAYDLTEGENIQHLKELQKAGKTVVLYGDDQLQANGPWMWFRQVGFDNVKILLGGYEYYTAHKEHLAETKGMDDYIKGIARYDYAKVASRGTSVSQGTSSNAKKPVVVRRKKKAAVAAGGC